MSAVGFDMHSHWREVNPRAVLAECRKRGGTITPYAKFRHTPARGGSMRSFIVSWPSEGCEGHLYVIRIYTVRRDQRRAAA